MYICGDFVLRTYSNGNFSEKFLVDMNKRLNKVTFAIFHVILCVLICLDKIFGVEIDIQIYLIVIVVSIVALGNTIVNILRAKKREV